MHPLTNPFHKIPHRIKPEAEVIGSLLGDEAQREFEKACRPTKLTDEDYFDVSVDELARLKREAHENKIWPRERYVSWAKTFGEDESWVDEHFVFQFDGTTITPGDIVLSNRGLTELPRGWVEVTGDCVLDSNKLTNLAGAPESVGGYFICGYNELTTLEGAPKIVGGCFSCCNNRLTSLAGAPESVGDDFDCNDNQLTSLKGAPKYVGGDFACADNQLISLDDLSETIKFEISAENNPISLDAVERAKAKWGSKLKLESSDSLGTN